MPPRTERPRHARGVPAALAMTLALGLLALPLAAQPRDPAAAEIDLVEGEGGRMEPLVTDEPIPTKHLLGIAVAGGPLMIPVGLCSLILLAFVFERLISLRRGRVIPKPFVTRFLQQIENRELDRETALALCEENGSPVAGVFAAAVRKWGRPSVEVEQAIIDTGERVANGLRRYLRVINGVATVSPLLGLLGTVVGMIRSFNAIAVSDAMGRPELLASGISEALLTTAAGLSVAIPALIFYLFFIGRVDLLIIDIDAMGQRLVEQISAEALDQLPPRQRAGEGAAAGVREPAKPRRTKRRETASG